MSSKSSRFFLIAGLVIFFVAFIISRLQFFACPTVEISSDSGEYMYWLDFYCNLGKLPPNNVAPLGYPIVIKLLTQIKDSVYPIVYFQITFTFLSFCVLLLTVWRFYNKVIYLLTLFLLCIYVQIPNNLFWDMYICSESIYTSNLVLVVSALAWFFNKPEKDNIILLSTLLAIPVVFRPSGIFCGVIFAAVILYLYVSKRKNLLAAFILPFSIVYASLCFYSWIASNDPIFIGKRVRMDISEPLGKGVNAHEDSIFRKIEDLSRIDKTITVYKNYTSQSQIYTRIEEANTKFFVRNYAHTNEFGCLLNIDSTKIEERKKIFKEFFYTDKMKFLIEKEKHVKHQKWFKLYDVFVIYIVKKIFLSPVWIVLLFCSLIFSVCEMWTSKLQNTKAWLLALVISINIGSAAAIIFTQHLPYPRYSYPGEFIFLLQLPFLVDLVRNRINAFK